MNGIVLGVAMLVSSTAASATPEPPRTAIASAIFSFELPDTAPRDQPRVLPRESPGPRQATSARRSRVDRIIAVAAGASIGWFVGGGIGYAVTPKRGPYDDTSGLKGVLIGAPVGG